MTHLNFGVIGVGEMGKFHAETLRYHVPGATLIAVADVNLAHAQRVAQNSTSHIASTACEALIERTDIDAVVISSPPKFHGSAIRLAAAARKQIFCEKPLTITLEDADSALDAVRRRVWLCKSATCGGMIRRTQRRRGELTTAKSAASFSSNRSAGIIRPVSVGGCANRTERNAFPRL